MNTGAARHRQVLAAVIGNALEWYDFVVYGFVSVIIARLFFPASNPAAGLLLTFATFGVGFFMRPVGGIVLGLYADRKGRKAAMQLIMLLMTVAVALVAFAPTYAAIGLGAPLLMVLARMLQGFAAGAEFASCTSYLFEVAPAQRRGYYGSMQSLGQVLAALGGSTATVLVTRNLEQAQIDQWGWRLPFVIGLAIGPVGMYIRRHLEESEEFQRLRDSAVPAATVRMMDLLRGYRRALASSFLLIVCGTSIYYVVLLYMPTYASTQLGLPLAEAMLAQMVALVCMAVLTPLGGLLSDLVGRKAVLLASTASLLVLPYPLLAWLQAAPSFARLLALQVVLCVIAAAYFGTNGTAMAEQFPTRVRSTGMGLAYNFAVMLFGGFAPFIITWLMQTTHMAGVPAFYMMFGATAGLAATLLLAAPAGQVESGARRVA